MLMTIIAFLVALAILIAIHEYGHYRMAVACGVKVLRFSVGFGPTVLRWKSKKSDTEFVIAALPLGGFVRMLDERESPVDPVERHLAFNTQPLRSRVAIVAAGPLANLLLAVLLYILVGWIGVQEPKAFIASPLHGSPAQMAGLQGGDFIQKAALGDADFESVRSFEDLRWILTRGALDKKIVRLERLTDGRASSQIISLDLSKIDTKEADEKLFRKIGIISPWTQAVIGEVLPNSPAQTAGLQANDVVLAVGDKSIEDGQQLREMIRQSGATGDKPMAQIWRIRRGAEFITLEVSPEIFGDGDQKVGRIGAYIGSPAQMTQVEYGFLDGIWHGFERTADVSSLTVRMMVRMLTGEASLKNLSGPLTIADYAGRSASMGWVQYLIFLALISVSLGVLNLLPLPVLDGGHLMYYLWEAVTGKPVSDAWMTQLQRGGIAFLLLMMSIAFFNDISRLFG